MIGYSYRDDEASLTWRKSSYSGGEQGQCVEVAEMAGFVHVRDSKNLGGAALTFASGQFAAFAEFAAQLGARVSR
ncbi:DUF397 domain-containing protein [Streptomyces sp. NPDC004610]|uniref:DUF397 domain-containing protein n=1 Tax=unclassified Streptomyces TaxID=2593676 RepID=UPI0033A13ACD